MKMNLAVIENNIMVENESAKALNTFYASNNMTDLEDMWAWENQCAMALNEQTLSCIKWCIRNGEDYSHLTMEKTYDFPNWLENYNRNVASKYMVC